MDPATELRQPRVPEARSSAVARQSFPRSRVLLTRAGDSSAGVTHATGARRGFSEEPSQTEFSSAPGSLASPTSESVPVVEHGAGVVRIRNAAQFHRRMSSPIPCPGVAAAEAAVRGVGGVKEQMPDLLDRASVL